MVNQPKPQNLAEMDQNYALEYSNPDEPLPLHLAHNKLHIHKVDILSLHMITLCSKIRPLTQGNEFSKTCKILAVSTKLLSTLIFDLNLVKDPGNKIITRFELLKVSNC